MTAVAARSVRDVADAALGWVRAHRGEFALGAAALAPDGQVDRTWKPLGELTQVCATVRRRTAPEDPSHLLARDLLDFAWRQTGHGELFLALQRQEPFATYPLEVYAAFAAAGLRHPGYEAAAATVARTRGWRRTEQHPTRRLGLLSAERHTRIHRPGPPEAVLDTTWLGGLPEPWTFERSAGYALTHVVFHLTDWGRAAQGGAPPALADYLTHWLPPWLDTCLEARMWDLSCELLAVAASVPGLAESTGSAVLREAWSRIAAAQHPSGAVAEEGAFETEHLDPGEDFTHCYHSTLMAAFAATLATATPATATPAPAAAPARPAGPGVDPDHRSSGQGALG
ncbi:DUF6895 family protein [Streptomyces ziwulingensis]|uniref:DUF6895 domain-containing protein n=1 Tax=Streptomyces ziwulingensis TaxID=1045501 RepID=A0ABP9B3T4_9ACTN